MAMDIGKMTMHEVLQHVSELPATKKSEALKQIANLRKEFKVMMWYVFRKDVKLELPEGAPPYRQMITPDNMGHNLLPIQMRKLEYFLPQSNLNSFRKEKLFIEMLESVSPDEAKILLMIKDKKLTYKGITRKLVEESLPEVFVGEK